LDYIKKSEVDSHLILREAMQGGKSEAKRLQDFKQKCGTIALLYQHETHIDYAAVIATIPVTVWTKSKELFQQSMFNVFFILSIIPEFDSTFISPISM